MYGPGENKEKLEVVLRKFDEYCNPIKSLVFKHYKFLKRDQLPSETFDQFLTVLKQLANTCEFKERDVLLLDRIVLGIGDDRVQEKLLQETNLTLEKAVTMCRAMESRRKYQTKAKITLLCRLML